MNGCADCFQIWNTNVGVYSKYFFKRISLLMPAFLKISSFGNTYLLNSEKKCLMKIFSSIMGSLCSPVYLFSITFSGNLIHKSLWQIWKIDAIFLPKFSQCYVQTQPDRKKHESLLDLTAIFEMIFIDMIPTNNASHKV